MLVRFGVFEFDEESGDLRKAGRMVKLEPQPAKALACLIAGNGALVTREALKAAIWGQQTHVDFDRGLAYCIGQVRSALGDAGDSPGFVQTVPRKGYVFLAPITRANAEDAAGAAPDTSFEAPRAQVARRFVWLAAAAAVLAAVAILVWSTRPAPPPASQSGTRAVIAVSVFDNETGLTEHNRLVNGLADLVVTRLSELDPSRIAVIGNAAALRQPRNIRNLEAVTAAVHADYILLGQLQQDSGGLRFITHVIRSSDQTHLRANRILLPGGDVTPLENAVVAEFERAIRQHVLADSPSSPPRPHASR